MHGRSNHRSCRWKNIQLQDKHVGIRIVCWKYVRINEKDIQCVSIYDFKGNLISKNDNYKSNIDIKNLSKGTYIIKIISAKFEVTKKLMID